MKKGGKIKAEAPHVPRLLLPIHYIPRYGLPFCIATPMPHYVAQGCPSHSLFHLTYLSLATPIRRMYLGHTIPSKGYNYLIRYLPNPLWSLETLAHAKAHYGRACHYEVPTLLSMVCKALLPDYSND